jgi:hypothetical protein
VNQSRELSSAQPTISLALLVQVGGILGPPGARSIIADELHTAAPLGSRCDGSVAVLIAFGFVLGPFVYLGHEMLWDYYSAPPQRKPFPAVPSDVALPIGAAAASRPSRLNV